MSKFKVGDRVRVVNPPSWLHNDEGNDEGIITELYANPIRHGVSINGGPAFYFEIENLELIVEKPKFAVGDTVDYALRGTVNRFLGLSQVVIDTQDGEWIADIDKLTKVTPPFPTKRGASIKAINTRVTGDTVKTYVYAPRAADHGDLYQYPWFCVEDNDYYRQDVLELISVEYVPND